MLSYNVTKVPGRRSVSDLTDDREVNDDRGGGELICLVLLIDNDEMYLKGVCRRGNNVLEVFITLGSPRFINNLTLKWTNNVYDQY